MTDTEIKRRKAICEAAHVDEIDDVSDGFHTFRQLYYQRMMLFAAIVKQNKDKAWKSLRHEDGELCFGGGWFIVGIDTPEGSFTYHYEDNYFSLFDCEELEYGKHWDGHTEKDVTRLFSLSSTQPEPCGDKLKEIADALSEKMCYINTCPNERDIILGYLGRERSSKNHCNTDCWNKKCESYHYETKQQSEPCEDAVSRKEAVGWFEEFKRKSDEMYEAMREELMEAPSVTPKPNEGKWIELTDCANEGVYCSECHKKVYKKNYSNTMKIRSPFCPNCGSIMDGVENK